MRVERKRHVAAEKGKLKLVRAGRRVETLTEPITAGEVMSQNPRHCITRTDVFKFPWIVIKPESVLPLGKVFLLVPYRTIRHLLKSENHRNQSSNSPRDRRDREAPPTTASPHRAFAGMTPKHHGHHRQQQQQNQQRVDSNTQTDHDHGDEPDSESDSSEEFHSPWMGQTNSYWEFLQSERTGFEGASTSLAEIKPHSDKINGGGEDPSSNSSPCGGEELGKLKSCLRKPDSARKSLSLKVSFVLPRREDKARERQRSASSSHRVRISDFVNW